MKKSLTLAICSLVVAVVVTVGAIFAWFTGGDVVYNIQFDIAVVDMRLALYRVNDFDLDGIPDLDENGNIILPTDEDGNPDHIFDTNGADSEEAIQQKMQKADTISDFMPTQVYTYRLDVYNHGDVNSRLNLHAATVAPDGYKVTYTAYYYDQTKQDIVEIPVNALPEGYVDGNSLANETEGASAPVPLTVGENDISLSLYIQVKFTLDETYTGDGSEVTDDETTDENGQSVYKYGTTMYITIWA